MLFQGTPGKTAFQQEWSDEDIQVPGGYHGEEKKRKRKENYRYNPEDNTGNPLK
jgi:hypothetical protein